MSLGQMLESRATFESEFCDDGYEYEWKCKHLSKPKLFNTIIYYYYKN